MRHWESAYGEVVVDELDLPTCCRNLARFTVGPYSPKTANGFECPKCAAIWRLSAVETREEDDG